MGKRQEIDGKFYRERRGKLVEIPEEWVGSTSSKQMRRRRRERAKLKHQEQREKLHKEEEWDINSQVDAYEDENEE